MSSIDLEAIQIRLPSSFEVQSNPSIQALAQVPTPVSMTQALPAASACVLPPPPTPPKRSVAQVEAKWGYETDVSLPPVLRTNGRVVLT